jgi:hypothetical protein
MVGAWSQTLAVSSDKPLADLSFHSANRETEVPSGWSVDIQELTLRIRHPPWSALCAQDRTILC